MIGSRMIDGSPLGAAALCGLVLAVGCTTKSFGPTQVANDAIGPITIAVAPAMNVSGSADLDPLRVADIMASELGYVVGVEVIPVNRVLAVLANQGRKQIESPQHALDIAKVLGADAVLVFAITEYDGYDPPTVGIAAQLYGERRAAMTARFDPVAESRYGAPSSRVVAGSFTGPLAQSEEVYDASHEWVCGAVRRFSQSRSADRSPLGWRKYVASQEGFLRFCCHATIVELTTSATQRDETTGERG